MGLVLAVLPSAWGKLMRWTTPRMQRASESLSVVLAGVSALWTLPWGAMTKPTVTRPVTSELSRSAIS